MQVPGIKVNLKSVDGCTPIMRALRRCKPDCVQAMMRVSCLASTFLSGIETIVWFKWCFREMVSIWRQQMEMGTAYEKLQE